MPIREKASRRTEARAFFILFRVFFFREKKSPHSFSSRHSGFFQKEKKRKTFFSHRICNCALFPASPATNPPREMARKQYGFLASRSWKVRERQLRIRAREEESELAFNGRIFLPASFCSRSLNPDLLLPLPLLPLSLLSPLSNQTNSSQAQHLALASLLALTAALSLAPLFGASSAG